MFEILLTCAIIAALSWKFDILSAPASFIALLIGALIWYMDGLNWLVLLVSFMVVGFLATKRKYDWKLKRGFEEPSSGQRDIENVLGNATSPTFFAILFNPVAFSGAISTALADTLASELGVFSEKAKLITTFKDVEPGTDGAISVLGTLCALIGSGIVAILGYLSISVNPIAPLAGGFLGCQIDSVLGATLERRGYLSKSLVNLIATFSGGLISVLIATV